MVRDSAGITIVENVAPRWRESEAWRLSAEPLVTIGTLEGQPAYQLHQLRPGGVIVLADGRILVANGGTSELRFFAADGRHLASVGQTGSGPGEFRSLWTVEEVGDEVHAFDRTSRRISIFSGRGEFVRSFGIDSNSGSFQPAGRFNDGSVAYAGIDIDAMERDGLPAEGRLRQSLRVLRVHGEGERIDTIGEFPGATVVIRTQAGQGGAVSVVNVMMQFPAFGANPQVLARGDRLVFGGAERYELEFLTPDGKLERLVRRAHTPARVTDADLDRLAEQRSQQARPEIAAQLAHPRDLPHADVFPAYAGIVIDATDHVWVQQYRRPGDDGPLMWDVFDPDGRWLGSVAVPTDLRVQQVGDDYVLGVWTDDLGVEYVHLYRLEKS